MRKIIAVFVFLAVFPLLGFLFGKQFLDKEEAVKEIPAAVSAPAEKSSDSENAQKVSEQDFQYPPKNQSEEIEEAIKFSEQQVPFIVQAPFGNWSDPIFQNACEESSIAMAMGWVRGTSSISAKEAEQQILDIVGFENRTLGYNTDTDLSDVEKIFKNHFKYENVLVKRNISVSDIIQQLQKGNIVIVPAFGQALANPNYTPPGPTAHMLVVTGYDPVSQNFITNDPGTRRGARHQYDKNVFFNAIWEYPSSAEAIGPPSIGDMKKSMLVVSKS